MPIQNMVLSPTSTSYLRTKVSLPSSPMRNTDRPAGTVFTLSSSRTSTGRLCSATSIWPRIDVERPGMEFMRIGVLDRLRLAGGLIDGEDDDAVLAAFKCNSAASRTWEKRSP